MVEKISKQSALKIAKEVFGDAGEDPSRMNDAEKLLENWAETALDPGQLHAIDELIYNHMCGEGEEPTAKQALLEQLAGRADELLAATSVYCLAEEVLNDAAFERSEAEDICNGTFVLPGCDIKPNPEQLLSFAHFACMKACSYYATFARFLHGSSTYVDSVVGLATHGMSVYDLNFVGIRNLCEELAKVEESLRRGFASKDEASERSQTRAADVMAAMDVVGVERVATRIASHYGLGAQAMVLAEECCELGHAATRVARVAGGGAQVPDDVRAELLEEAADVILMIGQLTWLVGIDPKDVESVMREKVTRTIVRGEIPFKVDEQSGS